MCPGDTHFLPSSPQRPLPRLSTPSISQWHPLPSPHALRNRKCSPRPAAVVGGPHRDRVPIQVRGDLPQVQQLLLGQEAGLRPDGIQDGSRVALSGVGGDERPRGHRPGRQYLGAAPPRTPRASRAWPSLSALSGRWQVKAFGASTARGSPSQGRMGPGTSAGGAQLCRLPVPKTPAGRRPP